MPNPMTRRTAFAAGISTAVSSLAPVAVAIASPVPDAALIRLDAEYRKAGERFHRSLERVVACENAANWPDRPDALRVQPDDRALGVGSRQANDDYYSGMDVEALRARRRTRRVEYDFDSRTGERWPRGRAPEYVFETLVKAEPWPEAQARADEIVTAYDAYREAERQEEHRSGLTAAEDEADALSAELRRIESAIIAEPARTPRGLAIKAGVLSKTDLSAEDRFNRLAADVRAAAAQEGRASESATMDLALVHRCTNEKS